MAIICNKYQSTRDFSFKRSCFVAEASDLKSGPGAHDGRVYDAACDVGFIMVSHVTGDAMLFVNDGHDLNGDEIAGWKYTATHISTGAGKWLRYGGPKLEALIIND